MPDAQSEIRIEGFTHDELLQLSREELSGLVFTGRPIVFRAGTANVLGEFAIRDRTLTIELAHIDGGGEGVLPLIGVLANRIARREALANVEWFVYATNCAKPNPKLRRVLERRGFTVTTIEGKGECYFQRVSVTE